MEKQYVSEYPSRPGSTCRSSGYGSDVNSNRPFLPWGGLRKFSGNSNERIKSFLSAIESCVLQNVDADVDFEEREKIMISLFRKCIDGKAFEYFTRFSAIMDTWDDVKFYFIAEFDHFRC